MPWFVKTETFRVPHEEARPHIRAHRAWVEQLRSEGVTIRSGYLVDKQGRPGGGGLLLLEAADYTAAEAIVREDPMIRSGCVEWQLHGWMPA
jgi:uncharacterized protein YciI